MTNLHAAAAIAVIAASVANVGAAAFGLWKLDEIAVRVEERADAASDQVVHEIRQLRVDAIKAMRAAR